MNYQKNFFTRLMKKEVKDNAKDLPIVASEATHTDFDDNFEDSLGEEMRPFNTPKTYEHEQTKSAHRIS